MEYVDESRPPRNQGPHMRGYDDDYLNDRRRAPRGSRDAHQDGAADSRPREERRRRRKDTYDASDEDDGPVRQAKTSGHRPRGSEDSPIPPPPIGEERTRDSGNGGKREHGAGASSGDQDDHNSRPREKPGDPASGSPSAGVASPEEKRRMSGAPQANGASPELSRGLPDGPPPSRRKSRRERERDPYEEFGSASDPRARREPNGRAGDYGDMPSRRSVDVRDRRRDELNSPPSQRRHDYDEAGLDYPRRRESKRMSRDDDRHRPSPRDRRPRYHDDDDNGDSDHEAPRPRRRRDEARQRDKYEDRGYASEAPRRRDRDDLDRGYRTDGRDHRRSSGGDRRRDRDRDRDRDRRDQRRDDYHDRDDRDRRRGSKRGGPDMNQIFENGQKTWTKVQPVAKPLFEALAKHYLEAKGAR